MIHMNHIIGQGGRTVFNHFSILLYERHGIKAMNLGIFGVNGEQMEDSVTIPWEPHRARYGLRYAPGSYIPNPQEPASAASLQEGGYPQGPSAQGGEI